MKKITILYKVGKRIKELRKIKKMSQEQLAERADLHPTLIGKMERSEINPTIVSLEKIAKAFNIPLSQLLAFPDDEKILDADMVIIDKAVEILNQILEIARSYTKNKK